MSRVELNNRFGDSFDQLFRASLLQKFDGKNTDIQGIENFIADFKYFNLSDSKGDENLRLELAWSRVVVADPVGVNIIYNNVLDWTMGTFRMPYDKSGTVFNPAVGTSDGTPITFFDSSGNQYLVGVVLRIPNKY